MENKYLLCTFESNGKKLSMGCGCPLKIVSISGIESPEYSVHTETNATEDGSTVVGKKIDERRINLVFAVDEIKNTEMYRQQLIHFFNPKHPVKMTINYCYTKAQIQCEINSFNFTTQTTMWDYLEANLELLCPYPYFSDLDNFGKNIAAITAQFAFPLVLGPKGKIMGYKTLKQEVSLFNKGDVDTGLEIRFTAKRGAVKNPKITNTLTGEFIEVLKEMEMGDVIVINTNAGKKGITCNGINISKDINKLSTYFKIRVGDNLIRYDANENYTNLDVNLYYSPKYLGV